MWASAAPDMPSSSKASYIASASSKRSISGASASGAASPPGSVMEPALARSRASSSNSATSANSGVDRKAGSGAMDRQASSLCASWPAAMRRSQSAMSVEVRPEPPRCTRCAANCASRRSNVPASASMRLCASAMACAWFNTSRLRLSSWVRLLTTSVDLATQRHTASKRC